MDVPHVFPIRLHALQNRLHVFRIHLRAYQTRLHTADLLARNPRKQSKFSSLVTYITFHMTACIAFIFFVVSLGEFITFTQSQWSLPLRMMGTLQLSLWLERFVSRAKIIIILMAIAAKFMKASDARDEVVVAGDDH
jgi:hypothetical protein